MRTHKELLEAWDETKDGCVLLVDYNEVHELELALGRRQIETYQLAAQSPEQVLIKRKTNASQ